MPKIALVDDDRNILTSVSLTLEAEGYQVATYTDGASGLEGLTTDKPEARSLPGSDFREKLLGYGVKLGAPNDIIADALASGVRVEREIGK